MLYLGQYNTLKVLRKTSVGIFLGDEESNEVLLPKKFVTENMIIDSLINVFIFLDHEERVTATTEIPLIELYTFSYLECVDVTPFGAFLSWGLQKHLFCPFKEQKLKMEIGKKYIVYLYLDEFTQRLVATAKYEKYIEKEKILLEQKQEVDVLISTKTTLGFNAIINDTYEGLFYNNEIHKNINIGEKYKAYIKNIRPDNKIDLCFEKEGINKFDDLCNLIIENIIKNNNFLPLTDESNPEKIKELLGISKRNFKLACGILYKEKKISLKKNGISLN